MWFKHRAWISVAWILGFLNLAAVWFAARPGEPWHASAHALAAVLFGLGAQRLAQRARPPAEGDVIGRVQELEAGLADLDKLHGVEGRLVELEERLDFTERAMVDARNRVQHPPKE